MTFSVSRGRSQISRADLVRVAASGLLNEKIAGFFEYQRLRGDTSEFSLADIERGVQRQELSSTEHQETRARAISGRTTQFSAESGISRTNSKASGKATPDPRATENSNKAGTKKNTDQLSHQLEDIKAGYDVRIDSASSVNLPFDRWSVETTIESEAIERGVSGSVRDDRAALRAMERTSPVRRSRTGADRLFWRSTAHSSVEHERSRGSSFDFGAADHHHHVWNKGSTETSRQPILLGPFSTLVPNLRRFATQARTVHSPNLKLLQRYAERGEGFDRIPRVRRRRWGNQLWIIFDSSERLIPYRDDYAALCVALERMFPWGQVRRLWWRADDDKPIPPPGTAVIALTDLGGLAASNFAPHELWQSYGKKLQHARCPAVAILPGALLRRRDQAARHWQAISWQHTGDSVDAHRHTNMLDALLVLTAPANRVEPGLLRQLRRLMGGNADSGLEASFWQAPELLSAHPTAATISPQARKKHRAAFAGLPRELRQKVLETIHQWRRAKGLEPLFAAEIKQLDADSQSLIPKSVREDIKNYFSELAAKTKAGKAKPAELAWCWEFTEDLDLKSVEDPEERRALIELWREARDHPKHSPGSPSSSFVIWQRAEEVKIEPAGVAFEAGSPLGFIASTDAQFVLEADTDFLWKSNSVPGFVKSWGCDAAGYWLVFSVTGQNGEIFQKMRWIPAGRFRMGLTSAHEVAIPEGFWLFDTPCTQALWTAVMGSNPSVFKSQNRPVENVAWHDVQEFIARINSSVPALNLSLPSETQWEYACRAGTTTEYNFGDNVPPGRANFDGIVSQTIPCASLPANPWGLYEMHGNVWEWCSDAVGSHRVLRGGCWDSSAHVISSSSAVHNHPTYRDWGIGFRCARELTGAEPEEETKGSIGQGQQFRRPFIVRSNIERVSFAPLVRPSWASGIGRDRYGLWVEFQFKGSSRTITQRMRWIPPGQFALGSPRGEEGREESEEPQHEVAISRGFWLFDTSCKQGLWTAVMGSNPSHFNALNLPVENVSWLDAQAFVALINRGVSGLNLSLPSEAQWEYACRAGTTTAFSFGSAVLANQVNFAGTQTVPCGTLPANPWGLYEMHGNVWEWCIDGARTYSHHPMIDPTGSTDNGSHRVLRGGSWDSSITSARSATRSIASEAYQANNTGFRCARLE